MPMSHGAGKLHYPVATLIGTYADWLASTLKVEGQQQALLAQLLQLLMQCECSASLQALLMSLTKKWMHLDWNPRLDADRLATDHAMCAVHELCSPTRVKSAVGLDI